MTTMSTNQSSVADIPLGETSLAARSNRRIEETAVFAG